MEEKIHSFAPLVGDAPRVLILGSMPGIESLKQHQYYAHPRNHFWPLLCQVLDEPLPEEYQDRVQLLLRRGIALWDLFASCERAGSLDQAIRKGTYNNLAGFLIEYPTIGRLFCNGQKALQGYQRYMKEEGRERLQGAAGVSAQGELLGEPEIILLPSSSPIPTKQYRRREDKLSAWSQITD